MFVKLGFLLFAINLAIAVFTSNLFISPKEKLLFQQFKTQKRSNTVKDAETRYAYMNFLIANVTRFLMLCGLVLIIFGYFFN